MAKARKKARTTAAKRPAKKAKRSAAKKRTTSKLKGRKAAKPKAKRRKARKQGGISGAVQTVTDVIRDVGGLRSRLGRGRFEDQ